MPIVGGKRVCATPTYEAWLLDGVNGYNSNEFLDWLDAEGIEKERVLSDTEVFETLVAMYYFSVFDSDSEDDD